MTRKVLYIAITLFAFNIFCGFNLQRIPQWFQAQWDYYNGKYVSSAQHYEKASAGDTDSVMQFNKGAAEYRDGDFETAEKQYTSAIESDPEFVDAYYNQGNARFRQGNLKSAIQSYEKTLEIDPEHEDARFNLEYVKKLLEQQNSGGDNADSEENKHSQDPQSSDKEGQSENDKEPEKTENGKKNDGSDDSDETDNAIGGQDELEDSEDQEGESGGGNSRETDEEPPSKANESDSNSSGLSDEMIERILDSLAEDERALAGRLERRQHTEENNPNEALNAFSDLWSIPDDLDSIAKKKRKSRDKEEIDW